MEIVEKETRRLLRPDQFAELIGCSKKRVQNLLGSRKIPGAVRIPRIGWRIRYDVFLQNIEASTEETAKIGNLNGNRSAQTNKSS